MEEKKLPKGATKGLALLATAIALFYVKDEVGINSITDFLLLTVAGAVICFFVAAAATVIGGAVGEKLFGKKSEVNDNTLLSCFMLALVALVLISKADSCTPEKVSGRLSLGEVLEAYDEKNRYDTYDSVFYYVRENARSDYSDEELLEKIGIDASEFVYEYLANHR